VQAANAGTVPACNAAHHTTMRQADFVSRRMWDKITKGLSRKEVAQLRAPLVFAEIMSYIKV
jgi:hypothetical protein